MVHSFRLLLVTGITCLSWVALASSQSHSQQLHSQQIMLQARLWSGASILRPQLYPIQRQPQRTVSVLLAQPLAQSLTQPQVQSRSPKSNFKPIAAWIALSLLPIGGVGATVYALSRLTGQSKPQPPPLQPSPLESSRVQPLLPHPSPHPPEQAIDRDDHSNSNGSKVNGQDTQAELPSVQPSQSSELLTPTTRLAKVDIVEALIADLHSPDAAKRRKSIWELGQRGDSRALQPLLEGLMDADSQQRSLILAAIAEISTRTLKPMHRALILSLQDGSPEVRKNAIRDITRICDQITQVSQLLQYAVSDTDEEVQETARWALGQLNRRALPEPSPKPLEGKQPPDPGLDP